MWERLTDLTFEQWVYHIFDHPDAWYHAIGSEFWDGPAATTVAYLTRLFEDPVPPLEGFTDAELNRGFWYLVSSGGSDMMFALMDASVPLADRLRCVSAMFTVFEQIFVPRCTPFLSHLDEPGVAPLNSACYMWWDPCLRRASPRSVQRCVERRHFGVMERQLASITWRCKRAQCMVWATGRVVSCGALRCYRCVSGAPPRSAPELRNYACCPIRLRAAMTALPADPRSTAILAIPT
jgi:hypothetical protein